jgi:hypothetical protein
MAVSVSIGHSLKTLLLASAIAIGGVSGVGAQEVAEGTLAAAIRSSGHPCSRVIESTSEGSWQWKVRCNSGWYRVTKNNDSTLEVTPLD